MSREEFVGGNIIAGNQVVVEVKAQTTGLTDETLKSGMIAVEGQNHQYKAAVANDLKGANLRGVFLIGGDGKKKIKDGEYVSMLTIGSEVFGHKLLLANGDAALINDESKHNLLYHAEIIVREE